MKLYLALLPFTAWVSSVRMDFAYCGIYALPSQDHIIKNLIDLNAIKEMEFDGTFHSGQLVFKEDGSVKNRV